MTHDAALLAAFTKLRQEWQEPTNIYLNAPVDGIHTVMTNVKFTRDKAYFEGLAKGWTRHRERVTLTASRWMYS